MKLTLPPITPGDWLMSSPPHCREIGIISRDSSSVADVWNGDRWNPKTKEFDISSPQGEANARAMAAVPALLRAFTGLMDQLEAVGIYIPGEDAGQWKDASGLSLSECEAALIQAGCTIEP